MADGDIELWTANPDDLDALYEELRGTAGLRVEAVPLPLEPGDQGSAVDVLTAALSGGAVTAFLQILQSFIAVHGPGFSLKLRRGKDRLEITAETLESALPALHELLDRAND